MDRIYLCFQKPVADLVSRLNTIELKWSYNYIEILLFQTSLSSAWSCTAPHTVAPGGFTRCCTTIGPSTRNAWTMAFSQLDGARAFATCATMASDDDLRKEYMRILTRATEYEPTYVT